MAANGVILPPNFFNEDEDPARQPFGVTSFGGPQ